MKLSSTLWLIPLFLVGCVQDTPTSATLEQRVFSILGGLEVGEALTLAGEEAATVFLTGGPEGREYIYVPFFAADSGSVRLEVEFTGENLQSAAASAQLSRSPAALSGLGADLRPAIDHAAHLELRQWERDAVNPLLRRGLTRGSGRELLRARTAAIQRPVPQVGEVVSINVPNRDPGNANLCVNPKVRNARAVAVTQHAVILEDLQNPVKLTAADVQRIAEEYDRYIRPVNEQNFGAPTDIDENGRVIVLITSALNESSRRTQGITVGFAFLPDLLPRVIPQWQWNCPASNEGEVFYIIAPDPNGTVGPRVSLNFVSSITSTIVVHELQHVVNFGRRLYLVPDAEELEDVWLNEGLSHMAEELLFYAVTGLRPRQNISVQTLQNSPGAVTAFNRFQADNIAIYGEYLETPEEESLMGKEAFDDDFATRGAAWAFLRYAADHEPGPDDAFFRSLVNSPVAGVRNLRRVLKGDPRDWMQRWTVSNFTDDLITRVDTLYTQPSWNYRSIFQDYPLKVMALGPDSEISLRLQGGGAAYLRLRAAQSRQASVSADRTRTAGVGQLRISVVRIR